MYTDSDDLQIATHIAYNNYLYKKGEIMIGFTQLKPTYHITISTKECNIF